MKNNQNLPTTITKDQAMKLLSDEVWEIANTLSPGFKEQFIEECINEMRDSYYLNNSAKLLEVQLNNTNSMRMVTKQQHDKQKQAIIDANQAHAKLLEENENATKKLDVAEGCKKYGDMYVEYCNNPTIMISLYSVRHHINDKYKSIYPENPEWKYDYILEILHDNKLIKGSTLRGYEASKTGEGLICVKKDERYFKIDFKIYMNLIDAIEETNYRYKKDVKYSIVNK